MALSFTISDVRQPTVKSKGNRYCGPAALSSLTGIDTQQAAFLIRQYTGRPKVCGTPGPALWDALRRLGHRVEEVRIPKTKREFRVPYPKPGRPAVKIAWQGPTLSQWMEQTKDLRGSDAFLVGVTDHWMVVQGNRRCCGISKEVVFFDDDPARNFLRTRVTHAFRIVRVSEVDVETLLPSKAQTQRVTEEVRARRLAKRLAEEYDVELDYLSDPKMPSMVYPPAELTEDENWVDPHEGDHTVDDWNGVLALVEEYVDLVKAKRAAEEQARGLQLAREGAAGEFKNAA